MLGGDQRGDEVVAGVVAAALEQLARPLVELGDGALDPLALVHQARPVELPLDPVRPLVQPRRVLQRRAHDRGDRQRRVGLGESPRRTRSGRRPPTASQSSSRKPRIAGRQRSAARGVKAGLTRLRRRRWSSPLMWRMLRAHLLVERALVDAEHLGDLHAREGHALAAQEERRRPRGRARSSRARPREPVSCGEVAHRRVEALAAQLGVEVELGNASVRAAIGKPYAAR